MENNVILADDKLQFQKEQDKMLNTLLTYRFFNPWRGIITTSTEQSLAMDSSLEIYLTNTCNQRCEYCYLVKYPELYPQDKNNPQNILHNLKLLYDYIIVNNFHIPLLDVFSGEIWHTQFGIDVLELTLNYVEKGMRIDSILIPTNCYFVKNNKTLHKIQTLINKFEQVGVSLQFSLSIDGKIADEYTRQSASGEPYSDEFYERVFTFAKFNNFKFHPMVSAANIKCWKENYKWWEQMLEYYDFDLMDIMMLEVRNNDWTDDTIKAYCDFITFLADEYFEKKCNNDYNLFANSIVNIRTEEDKIKLYGYVPWLLNKTDTFLGCTVSNHLTVRIGDLAICPCHRQAYDKYLYGYFTVEDDTITGIRAVNPQMAVRILLGNVHTISPRCSMCIYNECCMHGCFGSQLETNADPFFPIDSVCDFFKAKYHTILQYYRDKGLIDYYKQVHPNEFHTELADFVLKIEKLDREVYRNGVGKC